MIDARANRTYTVLFNGEGHPRGVTKLEADSVEDALRKARERLKPKGRNVIKIVHRGKTVWPPINAAS